MASLMGLVDIDDTGWTEIAGPTTVMVRGRETVKVVLCDAPGDALSDNEPSFLFGWHLGLTPYLNIADGLHGQFRTSGGSAQLVTGPQV